MRKAKIVNREIDVKCCSLDCRRGSKKFYTPLVSLWAMGYARGSHDPAVMRIDAIFCGDCRPKDAKAFIDEWFTPKFRADIRKASLSMGRAPFNWASAVIEWKEV